ncbi:MAG: peptide chain release factor N(5)-glutamine methyltransferase, partial [Ignavibacteriae bacterium]|nr:peptide chain release factor N(5)-glutamine methyltransferase [Ignavibacteriota bacterium]
ELMLCEVLECSRVQLYMNYEKPLSSSELDKLRLMTTRRAQREPLQYIIGRTEFYGLPFFVDSSVLIPRPETEILVEQVIKSVEGNESENLSILDIGTGSGCIAVTLAKKQPSCRVVGIDISPGALEVARRNADVNEVNVEFIRRDVLKEMKVKQPFDIIVSNPPYISISEMKEIEPELFQHEPHIALTDNGDGLEFYRRFAELFKDILASDGEFFVEFGYGQSNQVHELFSKNFDCIIYNDLADIPRVIYGKHKRSIIET